MAIQSLAIPSLWWLALRSARFSVLWWSIFDHFHTESFDQAVPDPTVLLTSCSLMMPEITSLRLGLSRITL